MSKYFPDLQNGVDTADVEQVESAFGDIETDITSLQNSKVDKETGKVLSSNDFTNELQTKLANWSHSLPEISAYAMDNYIHDGIFKTSRSIVNLGKTYTGYAIFISAPCNDGYNIEYYQTLYDIDGKIYNRYFYNEDVISHTDWQEYIPTRTITQQSAIENVSSTVTTYTFNPKSSVSPSAAFKINHTGTNTVTFNFGTPSNTGYTNEILVYFKTALDNAVVWGSNVKFTDDEIPTIEAGAYYRIVAEYNPIMSKWVVGIINDGKGA